MVYRLGKPISRPFGDLEYYRQRRHRFVGRDTSGAGGLTPKFPKD
ncbi:hypothetical protein N185_33235 [Sinorhizobium sp. GW3]|nr:hypothetical protein N185_33235 [Sinorhizobium sp. GW3]